LQLSRVRDASCEWQTQTLRELATSTVRFMPMFVKFGMVCNCQSTRQTTGTVIRLAGRFRLYPHANRLEQQSGLHRCCTQWSGRVNCSIRFERLSNHAKGHVLKGYQVPTEGANSCALQNERQAASIAKRTTSEERRTIRLDDNQHEDTMALRYEGRCLHFDDWEPILRVRQSRWLVYPSPGQPLCYNMAYDPALRASETANFVTRTQAVKRLQVSLRDFR
jgi:hypothetical protein